MIVRNIKDVKHFFKILEKCEGKVELITEEGDRLNLKSKLSQYIMMADIFNRPEIEKAEILFSEQKDVAKIIEHITYG